MHNDTPEHKANKWLPGLLLRDVDRQVSYHTTDYSVSIVGRGEDTRHIEFTVNDRDEFAPVVAGENIVAAVGDAPPIPIMLQDTSLERDDEEHPVATMTVVSAELSDDEDVQAAINELNAK